jgi:thioredoxin-dependent peroxiredoxin
MRQILLGIVSVGFVLSCQKAAKESSVSGAPSLVSAPVAAAAAPSAPSAAADVAEPLAVGTPVPDVVGVAQNGQRVRLADLRGRPVVVYFYPKDNTAGCTLEAQEIRDGWTDISGTHAVVIGVSADDAASHQAFAQKYDLPFLLLPDTDHAIAHAFGVPISNGHARRITFVIGKDGRVARVFPNVSPKGHGRELLEALRALGA